MAGIRLAGGRTSSSGAESGAFYTLSPSSFAFLWEDCRRCFYETVFRRSARPRTPMPKIFTVIDNYMKTTLNGRQLSIPDAPGGHLGHPELWVESQPIAVPGHSTGCIVRGRVDCMLNFSDGSYGVVDRKTCSVNDSHVPLYSRQLHAYAHALEHPAKGKMKLTPITRLGLLVFEPNGFEIDDGDEPSAALLGTASWVEVQRNDADFLAFLDLVLTVLEQPEPPPGSATCEWCRYRGVPRLSS